MASFAFARTAYVVEGGVDSTAVVDDAGHPFGSIQSAVTALGSDGGTVSVAKGTYTETAATTCVTLSAPVEVIGATGNAADVIVTRGTQTARIFKLDNAGAKIRHLTVTGGFTTGAGAYVTTNGGTIEDCIFDANRVSDWNYLGGIYMESGRASRLVVRNHTTQGHPNIHGIGIYLKGDAVCEDSLFYGNAVGKNATVYLTGKSVLRNCTVADNRGDTGYVGVWADSATCSVTNCLIYGNWSYQYVEFALKHKVCESYRGKAAVFVDCVSDVEIPNSINGKVISVAPFVDRANGDYRTTAALRERPFVGYSPVSDASFSADFRVSTDSYLVNTTLTFQAGSVCAAGNVTSAWDFGDGTTIAASTDADVAHSYDAAGIYTVTMTASDGSSPATVASHTVQIGARSVQVALGDDIQTAIDAAVPGTVIHLAPGVHKPSATLSITKGVTLVGDGGATNTVITAQNKRTVVSMNDYDAVIRNVAITGGKSDSGAGVWIGEVGGTLEGCIVTNNTYVNYGCRGTGVTMCNGRVQRCVIARNTCHGHTQSYAPGVRVRGGQVLNSLIAENLRCCEGGAIRAAADCGQSCVVNCTIVGNVGTKYPGAYSDNADSAKFINCAIFDNTGDGTDQGKVFGGKADSFVNCACSYSVSGGTDWKIGSAAFADPQHHDYRLGGSASICFDTGRDLASYDVTLGDLDLDGNPRIVDAIDVGCFENQKTSLVFDFTVATDRKILPVQVTLTPALDGSEESYTVDWCVSNTISHAVATFTGGDEACGWQATDAGVYTIWGVAHIGTKDAASPLHEDCLQLSKKDLYVLPANENAAWPYETEATAATNIADAVRAAADGATVHVLPGETAVHCRYEQVDLTRAITVQGESPNCGVLITNVVQKGVRRFFMLDNPGAVVANLAFDGGYTEGEAGAGANFKFSAAGGMVSNCLIRSGRASQYGGVGGVAYMEGGIVTHCEITGEYCSRAHHTQAMDQGAILILAYGKAKVQNCFIHDLTFAKTGVDYINIGPLVQGPNIDNVTIVHADIPDICPRDADPFFGCGIAANSADALIRNCVVVDVRSQYHSGALRPFVARKDSWNSCFVNCVGDAEPLNATCTQSAPELMFKNYAGGNYQPRVRGALYDAGTAIGGFESVRDFAGRPRVFGKAVDIGCLESQIGCGMVILVR